MMNLFPAKPPIHPLWLSLSLFEAYLGNRDTAYGYTQMQKAARTVQPSKADTGFSATHKRPALRAFAAYLVIESIRSRIS